MSMSRVLPTNTNTTNTISVLAIGINSSVVLVSTGILQRRARLPYNWCLIFVTLVIYVMIIKRNEITV